MSKCTIRLWKKAILILLVVLMAAGGLLQPAFAQGTSSQEAIVSGSLTQGDKAIVNTVFSVHNVIADKWFDTKSDGNGQFTFTLTDGNYELQGVWVVSESKWYPLNQEFTVSNGALVGAETLKVTLPTNNTIKNVTGKLTNDGVPVAHITFSIHSTGDKQDWYDTTTDANGQFSFTNVSDGNYQLERIWLPTENKWYPFAQKIFSVEGTATVNISFKVANGKTSVDFSKIDLSKENGGIIS